MNMMVKTKGRNYVLISMTIWILPSKLYPTTPYFRSILWYLYLKFNTSYPENPWLDGLLSAHQAYSPPHPYMRGGGGRGQIKCIGSKIDWDMTIMWKLRGLCEITGWMWLLRGVCLLQPSIKHILKPVIATYTPRLDTSTCLLARGK